MKVTLLGPVAAESGGRELALGGLKQRAVFALLALEAGRVVPLDRLIDELWRDEPPARATLSLQSYMSRLRRILAGAPDAPRIVTRPPGWVLTLAPDDVDVARFGALVDAARAQTPASAAATLRTALELWSGPALADLSALPFARDEAARLDELRLTATEMLLESRLAAGESDVVAELARRFVTSSPYRERGWSALMLALYRSGRQSEAVAAAAELRRVLGDELGLDPTPETRELEQRIRRQDPSLSAEVTRAPAQPSAPAPPVPPGTGLVGRDDVLAIVDEAVAAAARGHGRLVLLEGPAGLGKSAILGTLADRVRAAGGAVLSGSGVGAGVMPALWPWVTIVRDVAALRPDGERPDDPWELTGPGDLGRTRLYRGVLDLLAMARRDRPVAVLIDDAQGVDADTITLLALAVDALAPAGVLFAVAVRTDEPGAEPVLATLGRTRRDLLTRVPLTGLAAEAVAELVSDLSGGAADPAVAAAIGTRTAGNPLFVRELVQFLISERRLRAEAVYAALPAHVEEVLRHRLARLPEQTVALLTVAAIVAAPAVVEVLADVTGLDADAVLDGCEAALLAGLLVETEDGFRLSHDLVRQTLEQSVSSARRTRMHARIARALEAYGSPGPARTVEVARHLTRAAPVVGPAAAVPHLIAASEDALSRYSNEQAERNLRTALDLIAQVRDPVERAGLESQVRGRLATIQVWGRGVVTVSADVLPPPTDAAGAAGWMGEVLMTSVTGRYDWAVATAEAALATNPPPVGAYVAHFMLAWASLVRGQVDVATEQFGRFEDILASGEDVRLPGALAATITVAATGHEAVIAHLGGDEAGADARIAVGRARAGDAPPNVANIELSRCWLAAMRGDAAAAAVHVAACAAAAETIDSAAIGLQAAIVGGWADALLGDPSGADRADAAYHDYVATGLQLFTPLFLLLRAEARVTVGDPAAAASLVRASRTRSAELGDVVRSPRLLAFAARF
ncbi:AAA family ATPase [Actinoplanes bogorensis]|uniref:AAA family ATPase n=1 Tax=Paractinoplanes bogorensis TaxID=1610840 RepID=A0ABS5YLJ4_9ACTN|nr:BTAD domain-containing putative transcriptional regulator [Actinoplanes bogorensis]MBU2663604.1 AAA family ATPase [Actinoplanes bogorensis]